MAFPARVRRRKKSSPSATTTLPSEATSLGMLTGTPPRFQVPASSGFSMSRKSGVHIMTAELARKMLTPNVTTSCASNGPRITLLTAYRYTSTPRAKSSRAFTGSENSGSMPHSV